MTVSKLRWAAKKSARSALMLGHGSARRARPAPTGQPPVLRVLTYHRFGAAERDPWCVGPAEFERQLRHLAEHQLAVSLDDAVAFMRGERELRDGSVLITMDDGLSSVATHAAPLMRRYGVPGVAYVTTSLVGRDRTGEGEPERYLTWDEVVALPEAGVEIGSHAHTHRSLGRMALPEAIEEGARSKELLETHLGRPIHSFAYPFGMHRDETPATARALVEMGYTTVFIAQHGVVRAGTELSRIPRIKVEGGDPPWTFPLLCNGAMDMWRVVDATLWHLQRPEKS